MPTDGSRASGVDRKLGRAVEFASAAHNGQARKSTTVPYTARATVADLRRFGPETWERFNAGAIDQLWYYRSLSVLLSARLPGMLADELRVTVRAMEQLSGWWFDIGDPQSV